MRRLVLPLLMLAIPALARAHSGAAPQAGAAEPIFKLEKVSERVYCLYGRGGNVGFLVTDAGVLVVDDQFEEIAEGIVEQIRQVTDRPVRYLVNTHYHSDHTGGNPVFARLGAIVAHDNVRPRLLEYPEVVKKTFPGKIRTMEAEIAAIPDAADPWRDALERDVRLMKFFVTSAESFKPETAAPPGMTFDSRLTIWLGGEEVTIFHVAPAHTDGDAMVFFRGQKVLHTGDLLFNGTIPFVDMEGGGSVRGYVSSIDRAIASVPADTRVIPGHGQVTDLAGLKRERDFLSDLLAEVEKAVRSGRSKVETVRAIRMEAYPDIKPTFRSLGNIIGAAYDEVTSTQR